MTYNEVSFKNLLKEAVSKEGRLAECFSLMHDYSLINSYMLVRQQKAKGQKVKPCASFSKWQKMGGHIKRGSKALTIFIPKIKKVMVEDKESGEKIPVNITTGFFLKNAVFSFNDIDGIPPAQLPDIKNNFSIKKAMEKLNIKQVEYDYISGNSQGYCEIDSGAVALNPLAVNAFETILHEVAHAVLHLDNEGKEVKRNIKEVEAECTAYIVVNTLGIKSGNAEMRGYIQDWAHGAEIDDKTARRIFSAASKILKAGMVV